MWSASRSTTRNNFLAQLEDLIPRMTPRPKALIVNFPSNPTTECVELPFLARLVELAREYGFHLIHDLAYADIAFDGYKPPSVLEVPGAKDVAVEFFTLSKSYNMPGWRVGFMVGNPVLVNALARLKSYFDYGTFTPIQVASICCARRPAGVRQRNLRNLPQAPRRARRRAQQGRLACPLAQGHYVRLGADSRAVPPPQSLEFSKLLLTKPRSPSPPASASAITATAMSASPSSRMKSAPARPCAASSRCSRSPRWWGKWFSRQML